MAESADDVLDNWEDEDAEVRGCFTLCVIWLSQWWEFLAISVML